MRFYPIIPLFLMLTALCFALGDAGIYLRSSVSLTGELRLGDIARIEADDYTAGVLAEIIIHPEIYSDGFIDSRELRMILAARGLGHGRIFGTAVRVNAPKSKELRPAPEADGDGPIIVKGDSVDVFVKRNGIVIQTAGKALDDGKLGDHMDIRTLNARRLRGVITGRGTVEVLP